MNRGERRTLYLMIIGVIFYCIIASIPVLIFTKSKLKCELGIIIGGVISILMLWHMNYTLGHVMHMEKNQSVYLALNSACRLLVVAGLIVLAAWTGFADAVFMVVGMLGLKFGAYIQPFLEKRFKIKNK